MLQELYDLVRLAKHAMKQASRDGGEYDIDEELAEYRKAIKDIHDLLGDVYSILQAVAAHSAQPELAERAHNVMIRVKNALDEGKQKRARTVS